MRSGLSKQKHYRKGRQRSPDPVSDQVGISRSKANSGKDRQSRNRAKRVECQSANLAFTTDAKTPSDIAPKLSQNVGGKRDRGHKSPKPNFPTNLCGD